MTSRLPSGPALDLVDLIQSNAVLRTAVEERPDLLALFIRAGDVAAKMSSDRSRLLDAVTRAADASDLVIETIRKRHNVELIAHLLLAAQAIENLGDILKEFFPIAVATGGQGSEAPN